MGPQAAKPSGPSILDLYHRKGQVGRAPITMPRVLGFSNWYKAVVLHLKAVLHPTALALEVEGYSWLLSGITLAFSDQGPWILEMPWIVLQSKELAYSTASLLRNPWPKWLKRGHLIPGGPARSPSLRFCFRMTVRCQVATPSTPTHARVCLKERMRTRQRKGRDERWRKRAWELMTSSAPYPFQLWQPICFFLCLMALNLVSFS